MASHMRTGLINEALAMATRVCPPVRGTTVFHSDRGSQYTSAEYAKIMADHEILPSVGRTGICYDNAAAESFNGTLKKELVNRKVYPTRTHPNPGRDILDRTGTQSHTTPRSAIDHRTPDEIDAEPRHHNKAARTRRPPLSENPFHSRSGGTDSMKIPVGVSGLISAGDEVGWTVRIEYDTDGTGGCHVFTSKDGERHDNWEACSQRLRMTLRPGAMIAI